MTIRCNHILRALVFTMCLLIGLTAVSAETDGEAQGLVRRFEYHISRWDVNAAERVLERLHARVRDKDLLVDADAMVAYLSGDYDRTWRLVSENHETVYAAGLYRRLKRLRPAFSSFQERRSKHFILRVQPGADEVLLDYCLPVLERALETNSKELGVQIDDPIIVEFFTDTESLHLATTLPRADIERTSAVAVCKFNRIIMTTPRMYLQGYAWADTLAHEMAHYLVAKKTGQSVPVWLHEGIAKWQETRWRGLYRPRGLDPMSASLLNRAVRDNKLIPFSKMHPSIAMLDSQEEAALAYAQCVTFVEHFTRCAEADQPLAVLLDRIAAGRSIEEAFEDVTGAAFEDLRKRWRKDLLSDPPEGMPDVAFRPRQLARSTDNAQEEDKLELDMIEKARRFCRLGDMLMRSSRHEAAIIEYRKAAVHADGVVPQVNLRLAKALINRTSYEEAMRALEQILRRYPDHVTAHKYYGLAALRAGDYKNAVAALHRSIYVNPFDPAVHHYLGEAYERLNYDKPALRERKIAERLLN